jgi:hypothetical protein
MQYTIPDLDLDMSQSAIDAILGSLHHIPASKLNDKGISPHGVGNYFMNIPYDRLTGLASIDYKRAEEEFGYIKIDFLHNTVYDQFENRDEVLKLVETEPNWRLLYKKEIVEQLPHINNYYTLLSRLPRIMNIEDLAKFIAIIRPAKKYLIDEVEQRGWDSINDRIWIKESDGYQFKKSHAIAFALMIKVAMLKLMQQQDQK